MIFPKWCMMNLFIFLMCICMNEPLWKFVLASRRLVLCSYSYIFVGCVGVGWQWKSILRDADRHATGWGRRGSSATWQTFRAFLSVCTGYMIHKINLLGLLVTDNFHTHLFEADYFGSHMFLLVFLLALSKPHLLEGKGHNRQSSDSSVDRFIPKEEVLEPAELNNKVN